MAAMIEVQNLGKKYRLGGQDKYYKTLRESLVRGLKRPFQRLIGTVTEEDEFWALRNVSFTVDEGEVVGIIGRNGAGKSTLLKLLARITRPTEGSAKLYGRVGSLLEVGTGFHPELTGRENIYLSGNILGMTRAEVKTKFDEIVDFSGVEKFLDTPVKHYSSGMYVRLGFAIAAHLEPDILLVDEVLAVGDAQFQKKCLGKMNEVAESGRTVLFVSHNMAMIDSLCSRCIYLNAGQSTSFANSTDAIRCYYDIRGSAGEVFFSRDGSQPGDNQVRLIRVMVLNHEGKPSDRCDIAESVSLVMEYDVCIAGVPALAHFLVRDSANQVLFTVESIPLAEGALDSLPLRKGRYRFRCDVPANFFNTGTYSVDVFARPYNKINEANFFEKSAISFTMTEDMDHNPFRLDYFGPIEGSVRPLFPCQNDYLGEQAG